MVKNNGSSIWIWSAKMALEQNEDSHRMYTKDFFIRNELVEFIESVFAPEVIEDFRNLIEKCNSDMIKNMLLKRLQNYISNRER